MPSRLEALSNPEALAGLSRSQLQLLLAETLTEMRACHLRTGMLQAKQTRTKVEAYHRSQATSAAGRERDADAQALDLTELIIEEKAALAALDAEAAIYRLFLEED